MLTQKRLREVLHYSPDTGEFLRLVTTSHKIKPGSVAGTVNGCGYRQINIDGTVFYAHRLAWFYMTGEWPMNDIDHLNGARADNRWSNLRSVDRRTNLENQRAPSKNNKLGLLGVIESNGSFIASITTNRKHIHLGSFDTAEDAHRAYLRAKKALHVGCTLKS